MADRLLQYQRCSALDLVSASELGESLALAATRVDSMRFIPVLPGRLGPSDPFPELRGETDWRPLPPEACAHVVRPAFVELGSDVDLAREFPGAAFALLDLATEARSRIGRQHWYAIRWSGGGWIRRLRVERDSLIILGQAGLRPFPGPARIELGKSVIEEHVRALVIWMGQDPKLANPLRISGYLVPPPAEAS